MPYHSFVRSSCHAGGGFMEKFSENNKRKRQNKKNGRNTMQVTGHIVALCYTIHNVVVAAAATVAAAIVVVVIIRKTTWKYFIQIFEQH